MTRGHQSHVPRPVRQESGQITILVVGFAVVIAMAVAVVANASHAFLERRALVSWTDGAVTVAAQQVDPGVLYGGEEVTTLPISESAARDAVLDYAARNDLAGQFDNFRVVAVGVDAGTGRVTVELAADVPFMLVGDVTAGASSFTVTARATAVVPLE